MARPTKKGGAVKAAPSAPKGMTYDECIGRGLDPAVYGLKKG